MEGLPGLSVTGIWPLLSQKRPSLLFSLNDGIWPVRDITVIEFKSHDVAALEASSSWGSAVDDIKQLFFGNMSKRAAKIMEEGMEALGAVRKREVNDAR